MFFSLLLATLSQSFTDWRKFAEIHQKTVLKGTAQFKHTRIKMLNKIYITKFTLCMLINKNSMFYMFVNIYILTLMKMLFVSIV